MGQCLTLHVADYIHMFDILNWQGFLVGLAAFFMIGLFHPIVSRMEYHLGKQSWWMLFVPGMACLGTSLLLTSLWSILLGCLAFSFFWSTYEIFLQHERVMKGRAPRNPKRNDHD